MDEKKTAMEPVAAPAGRPVIDDNKIRELTQILNKYKTGKSRLERRVVSAENWWKLRNETEEAKESDFKDGGFRSKSGWLHNVIVSKHADVMEAYPDPIILPREPNDEAEAKKLSSIIPVVLGQNKFESTYSKAQWSKLKTGTGVYKIVWDASKLNGLGDISIQEVDLLNLFWEPGVEDIQESKYFFHTCLTDNEALEARYPFLKDQLKGDTISTTKFMYDDTVPTDGKSTVVDCYYKKWENGKQTLHYVKFVCGKLLYSSENEGKPLYDHGLYPFVFDALFPVEGAPYGYGFVDLCKNPQTALDLMDSAFIRNTMVGAMPRYFARSDASFNEEQFLDLSRPLVKVDGNLGADGLRAIENKPLPGNYISYFNSKINELRETSGNTETATGSTAQGVTAASAIAALQEASGKGSRDSIVTSYRAFGDVVNLVIELIRQFYNVSRQFRITGENGDQTFTEYSNEKLKLQPNGYVNGEEMLRLPIFDIDVKAQKASTYTKMSQNELALQFYNLGFFSPQQVDQTMMCLDMMEFEGKQKLAQRIANMGGMFRELITWKKLAISMAMKYDPAMAEDLINKTTGQPTAPTPTAIDGDAGMPQDPTGESTRVANARAQARGASQPGGTV